MTTATIPAFKIIKNDAGYRFVKLATGHVIPAEIAGLCTGKDRWLSQIKCKCRECGESFPLSMLQGGGQWCEECQTKDME
jgi:hypothetical protein